MSPLIRSAHVVRLLTGLALGKGSEISRRGIWWWAIAWRRTQRRLCFLRLLRATSHRLGTRLWCHGRLLLGGGDWCLRDGRLTRRRSHVANLVREGGAVVLIKVAIVGGRVLLGRLRKGLTAYVVRVVGCEAVGQGARVSAR